MSQSNAAEKAIREIAERRAAEEKARRDAEAKAEAERARMASAGDVEKLRDYIDKLTAVLVPEITNGRCRTILADVDCSIRNALHEVNAL